MNLPWMEALWEYWPIIAGVWGLCIAAIVWFGWGRRTADDGSGGNEGFDLTRPLEAEIHKTLLSLNDLSPARLTVHTEIYIPRHRGEGLTLLDFVVVGVTGVFVIQTQRGTGVVTGNLRDEEWTLVSGLRRQVFINPLMRNSFHVEALAQFLNLDLDVLHSLIVFDKAARFEMPVPANVMTGGLVRAILSRKAALLTDDAVARINKHLEGLAEADYLDVARRTHSTQRRRD